jgi:pimeloyl-ACP methyl ester carboxylesterase
MARLLHAAQKVGRYALNRRGLDSREVRTRVGTLHAYDGRGPGELPHTVVLHGIGSAATPFGAVLSRLQRHAKRVSAPDMPGHGFSPEPSQRLTPEALTDAMRDALDHLIDEPAVLCGNSLGGAVALRYAIERPEKVRGLVLISPAGARFTDAELDGLRKTFDLGSTRDTVAFLERLYHRPPWFAPLLAGEVREMMRRPVVQDLLRSATPDHAPTPEEVAALPMPVLFLWGRSERLLPASSLEWFRRHLPPHAVVEEPHGVGHCPHFDDPAALAARIVEFARTLPR